MNSLNQEQQSAVEKLTEAKCGSLTGYAGVGKTYTMAALADALQAKGAEVVLTAPTHKAAKVLSAKTGRPVATIHSTLRLIPLPNNSDGSRVLRQVGEPDLPSNGVLIVDEASMLSDPILDIIEGTDLPVIYVGDPAQLPPVGADFPVFMHRDTGGPKVSLTTIMRQAGDNPLPLVAAGWRPEANSPQWPRVDTMGTEGGVMVRGRAEASRDFVACAVAHFESGDGSDSVCPWLTYTNRAADAAGFNARRAIFGPAAFQNPYLSGEMLIVNNPVVIENVIALQTSTPVRMVDDAVPAPMEYDGESWPLYKVKFETEAGSPFDGHAMPFEARKAFLELLRKEALAAAADLHTKARRAGFKSPPIPSAYLEAHKAVWEKYYQFENGILDLRTIYASTTHKSQGSTYPTVFVDQMDMENTNAASIRRALVYTAITRPSHTAIIAR